ncbi:putative 8 kDa protein [Rose yellow leaf virus]|nr:putative 8 kDa protein [Rose yellow leaf virus]
MPRITLEEFPQLVVPMSCPSPNTWCRSAKNTSLQCCRPGRCPLLPFAWFLRLTPMTRPSTSSSTLSLCLSVDATT